MFDLTYSGRRSRNHRFLTPEYHAAPIYGDFAGAYSGFGNNRNGLLDHDRSAYWFPEREAQNSVEDATRAHVAAKSDWEKAREKFDEAKKKLEECEKKLKECEDKLRSAKYMDRYG
ncbi:hypothetical protein T440DRAFT_225276 [Plenodomus tracheiphilus IPT5]|uniref:Uncharacterized protein n=1 Tax=Plenodomus tracheiphilus IPT5 TaxID=1408161 RepID=A0A6A7AWX7_9PLEO|nr:hypothetical protein T440DRAFT_225276 [Plenodomus tracheiphilus IPT5]